VLSLREIHGVVARPQLHQARTPGGDEERARASEKRAQFLISLAFFLTALRQWMRIDNKITIKKHYDAESPLDLIEATLNFTTARRES
jgi:hypothetical protein